jgi:hypothetical protein
MAKGRFNVLFRLAMRLVMMTKLDCYTASATRRSDNVRIRSRHHIVDNCFYCTPAPLKIHCNNLPVSTWYILRDAVFQLLTTLVSALRVVVEVPQASDLGQTLSG